MGPAPVPTCLILHLTPPLAHCSATWKKIRRLLLRRALRRYMMGCRDTIAASLETFRCMQTSAFRELERTGVAPEHSMDLTHAARSVAPPVSMVRSPSRAGTLALQRARGSSPERPNMPPRPPQAARCRGSWCQRAVPLTTAPVSQPASGDDGEGGSPSREERFSRRAARRGAAGLRGGGAGVGVTASPRANDEERVTDPRSDGADIAGNHGCILATSVSPRAVATAHLEPSASAAHPAASSDSEDEILHVGL